MSFLSLGWLVAKIMKWWQMRRSQKAHVPEQYVPRFASNPVSFGARVLSGAQAVIVHALMPNGRRRFIMLRYDLALKMLVRDGDGLALFAATARTPCRKLVLHQSVSEILHALSVHLMRGDAKIVTLIFGHPTLPSRESIDFIDISFAEIEPIEICDEGYGLVVA